MIVTLLRKPLEGTVAENTLKHGCGAINIDATRVSTKEESYFKEWDRNQSSAQNHVSFVPSKEVDLRDFKPSGGRWPANFILLGQASAQHLDVQSSHQKSGVDQCGASRFFKQFGEVGEMVEYFKTMIIPPVDDACVIVGKPDEIDFSAYKQELLEGASITPTYEPMAHGCIFLGEPTDEQAKEIMGILKPGAHVVMIPEGIGYKGVISLEDTGFEVRDAIFVADGIKDFHCCSKASRSEREAGVSAAEEGRRGNTHPTVKPVKIMEWCARDISPCSKIVDPFMGSGTTGIAMSRLGHHFVGIELNEEYASIARARIDHWGAIKNKQPLRLL